MRAHGEIDREPFSPRDAPLINPLEVRRSGYVGAGLAPISQAEATRAHVGSAGFGIDREIDGGRNVDAPVEGVLKVKRQSRQIGFLAEKRDFLHRSVAARDFDRRPGIVAAPQELVGKFPFADPERRGGRAFGCSTPPPPIRSSRDPPAGTTPPFRSIRHAGTRRREQPVRRESSPRPVRSTCSRKCEGGISRSRRPSDCLPSLQGHWPSAGGKSRTPRRAPASETSIGWRPAPPRTIRFRAAARGQTGDGRRPSALESTAGRGNGGAANFPLHRRQGAGYP